MSCSIWKLIELDFLIWSQSLQKLVLIFSVPLLHLKKQQNSCLQALLIGLMKVFVCKSYSAPKTQVYPYSKLCVYAYSITVAR